MMFLSAALESAVHSELGRLGDSSTWLALDEIGGGCINHASRLQTGRGLYLLKWNPRPAPGMIAAEVRGLELLRETRTVRVPEVLAWREAEVGRPAFALLEWLSGPVFRAEALGRALALLHQAPPLHAPAGSYGLAEDNFIGSNRQKNGWDTDWVRFFAERRLLPQIDLAARGAKMTRERAARLERLVSHLPDWLGGVERRPCLLHGDLWPGNVINAPGGPALIDPAVYYGDREAEIAFTGLFGGFGSKFYAAYEEVWPLAPDWREREDLYNLYHLLNHLNLFGEDYGFQVDAVLARYV